MKKHQLENYSDFQATVVAWIESIGGNLSEASKELDIAYNTLKKILRGEKVRADIQHRALVKICGHSVANDYISRCDPKYFELISVYDLIQGNGFPPAKSSTHFLDAAAVPILVMCYTNAGMKREKLEEMFPQSVSLIDNLISAGSLYVKEDGSIVSSDYNAAIGRNPNMWMQHLTLLMNSMLVLDNSDSVVGNVETYYERVTLEGYLEIKEFALKSFEELAKMIWKHQANDTDESVTVVFSMLLRSFMLSQSNYDKIQNLKENKLK